jgi:hypothetical protein
VRTDAKANEQKPPRLIVTAIKQASSSCEWSSGRFGVASQFSHWL